MHVNVRSVVVGLSETLWVVGLTEVVQFITTDKAKGSRGGGKVSVS